MDQSEPRRGGISPIRGGYLLTGTTVPATFQERRLLQEAGLEKTRGFMKKPAGEGLIGLIRV